LGDGVPKLALGGPPGGSPGQTRLRAPYMVSPEHKTLEKRNEERHGAIDRKRGVKTPTKA
jgi:hypothetical protein